MTGAVLRWVRAGRGKRRAVDTVLLGTLQVTPGRIVAEVNSERRASRLKRELAKIFRTGARLVDVATTTPAEALAEREAARAAGTLEEAPEPEMTPEIAAHLEQMFREHLEAWVDEQVPALGGRTPRQAARTAAGRERLRALVNSFEDTADDGPPNARRYLAELRVTLRIGPDDPA